MRTSTQIALVLLGNGALLGGAIAATRMPSQECREARAAHRLDENEVCNRPWYSSGHGGGTSSGGSHWGSSSDGHFSVMRGGFGSTGLHFFGLGG